MSLMNVILAVIVAAIMDQVPPSPEAGRLRGALIQDESCCREALLRNLAERRYSAFVPGSRRERVGREFKARSS